MSSVSTTKIQQVLLTGPPGVGKTTLVKKVYTALRKRNLSVAGFYTKEVRNGRQRMGFDVVTVDGEIGPLARLSTSFELKELERMPRVGQYAVDIKSFESLAIPSIKKQSPAVILLDEIGKMELFSESFKQEVLKVFEGSNVILATIPLPKGRPIPFVENIKRQPHVKVIMVTQENRNLLEDEIIESLLPMSS